MKQIILNVDESELEYSFLAIDRSDPNQISMFTPKHHKDLENTEYYETGRNWTHLERVRIEKFFRTDIAIINEKYRNIYTGTQYLIYANVQDGNPIITGDIHILTEEQKEICLNLVRKLMETAAIYPEFNKYFQAM